MNIVTVSFLRTNQTYIVEQKRRKRAVIGKRVACYDNTFMTDLDANMPFDVAEAIICAFVEDVLLRENRNRIEEETGKGWEYCNLQISENEITGKLSFCVRLAAQTNESVYAAEIDYLNKSSLCCHATQLEILPEEQISEE